MRSVHSLVVAASVIGLALVAARPGQAQQSAPPQELYVYGTGGGLSPLTSLDGNSADKFKTGFTVGGGVGWRLLPILDLRGDFNYGEATVKNESAVLAGEKYRKLYYGAEFVLRYPTRSGFAPFIGVGAGGVTIDPSNSATATLTSFTKFAGRSSIGLEYAIPKSKLSLLTQATGWLYKVNQSGLDKTQLDLQYNVGVSYRFPF